MDEKRRLSRKLMTSNLNIFSKDCQFNIGKGHVVDLSEHGMRMTSEKNLAVGQELMLHFRAPNSLNLDFKGKIVHKEDAVNANAYGVKFLAGQDTFILKLL
jgi:hypothetical protein